VTGLTSHGAVRPGQGKLELAVIDCRSCPAGRAVAHRAVLRQSRARVVGILRVVVIGLVARRTGGGQRGVLAVCVTTLAIGGRVRSRQRKAGLAVIKDGAFPLSRRMTERAILWKSRPDVVGIARIVEIVHMARRTRCGKTRVLAIAVADLAIHTGMCPGQREFGLRVIECRPCPLDRGVASGAVLRKGGGCVIRAFRVGEVCQMAGSAAGAGAFVLIVLVALIAGQRYVRAGQRIGGGLAVIEKNSPLPLGRRVTQRAVLWKAGGHVVGIFRIREILQMAGNTAGVDFVFLIGVALIAGQRYVPTGEREFCQIAVVVLPAFPRSHAMAARAILRQSCDDVTGVLGAVELGLVARHTCRRRDPVIIISVACGALHG